MAFDWRKVFYPVAGDLFAPHLHMKQLADTTGGIVPAVNQADRDAIYAAAVAAGVDPAANPVIVDRLDTGQLERNAGSVWTSFAPFDDTGWLPAGASSFAFSAGWSASAPVSGWQSLALRRVGHEVRLNGLVQKATAIVASDVILTVATEMRPTARTAAGSVGVIAAQIQPSGAVVATAAGAAATAQVIDLSWWL